RPLQELGLDSLMAVDLRNTLGKLVGAALPTTLAFDYRTPAAIAGYLLAKTSQADARTEDVPTIPIAKPAELDSAPLSSGQQRLWFLERLAPNKPLYHLNVALRLAGPLNPEALITSLSSVVARHPSLRTTFFDVDGIARVKLRPQSPFELPVI